jgi:hypothetical protein
VPRRRRTPRAERSSAREWLGRLSDGPWARFVLCVCLGLFAFVFYEFKRVSPDCLGDPYGYPRQVPMDKYKTHVNTKDKLTARLTEFYRQRPPTSALRAQDRRYAKDPMRPNQPPPDVGSRGHRVGHVDAVAVGGQGVLCLLGGSGVQRAWGLKRRWCATMSWRRNCCRGGGCHRAEGEACYILSGRFRSQRCSSMYVPLLSLRWCTGKRL